MNHSSFLTIFWGSRFQDHRRLEAIPAGPLFHTGLRYVKGQFLQFFYLGPTYSKTLPWAHITIAPIYCFLKRQLRCIATSVYGFCSKSSLLCLSIRIYAYIVFWYTTYTRDIFKYIYIYTRWLTFPRVHAHAVHAGLTAWGRRCDVQAKSTVCFYAVVCYYAINCEYYALWILMNTYDTYDQYRWSTTPRHCSNSRTTSHWFAFSCQCALYNPLNFTPHCLHLFVV